MSSSIRFCESRQCSELHPRNEKERVEEYIGTKLPVHAGNDRTAMTNGRHRRLIDLALPMLRFDSRRRMSVSEAPSHHSFDEIQEEVRRKCVQGLAAQ
jgi:hypothetical protein